MKIKAKEEKQVKVLFEDKGCCPYCKKRLIARQIKTLIREPVPAEYQESFKLEKDAQKTIAETVKKNNDNLPLL